MLATALLALLPLLTSVTAANWEKIRTIDFQWANPDRFEYQFEPLHNQTRFFWEADSPSYPDGPQLSETAQAASARDTIAKAWLFGDSTEGDKIHSPIDFWWTPDREDKDVVRKKCALSFDGDPGTDLALDLKTGVATATDDSAKDVDVKRVTHFECEDAPLAVESE